MALPGSETHAREAYQRALAEIHAVAATVNRITYHLREPHRPWSAAERAAVRRYADGWARLWDAHEALDKAVRERQQAPAGRPRAEPGPA